MIEIINPAGLINLSKTVERVFFFNSTISHKSVSAKMIPNLQIHTYCNVILCHRELSRRLSPFTLGAVLLMIGIQVPDLCR